MQDTKSILQAVIVAALVVIGGLLFSIYRKMDMPKPEATAAVQPSTATPATASPSAGSAAPSRKTSAPMTQPKEALAKATQPKAKPNDPAPVPATAAPAVSADSNPAAASVKAVESASATLPGQPAPSQPAYVPPPPQAQVTPPPPARTVTLPAGTAFTVRLLDHIDSERNRQGDTFQTSLEDSLVADGIVIAHRGSSVMGRLVESKRAGHVSGVAELTLELQMMRTICGDQRIESDVIKREGQSSRGNDGKKIGILTGLGAAIGAIAGGGKGAAIGAGAGAAAGTGDVIATRGKPLKLNPETRLVFRLRSPLTLSTDGTTPAEHTPEPEMSNRPVLRRQPQP